MTDIRRVGIDLAKRIFHVTATDQGGRVLERKSLRRKGLNKYLALLAPGCTVAMESCGSANHWGRYAKSLGTSMVFETDALMRWACAEPFRARKPRCFHREAGYMSATDSILGITRTSPVASAGRTIYDVLPSTPAVPSGPRGHAYTAPRHPRDESW